MSAPTQSPSQLRAELLMVQEVAHWAAAILRNMVRRQDALLEQLGQLDSAA